MKEIFLDYRFYVMVSKNCFVMKNIMEENKIIIEILRY